MELPLWDKVGNQYQFPREFTNFLKQKISRLHSTRLLTPPKPVLNSFKSKTSGLKTRRVMSVCLFLTVSVCVCLCLCVCVACVCLCLRVSVGYETRAVVHSLYLKAQHCTDGSLVALFT